MVKMIGVLLIATSLLSLIAGAWIDAEYGSSTHITGNVISGILTQQPVSLNFFDYLVGISLSYSIVSFIIGIVFLIRL